MIVQVDLDSFWVGFAAAYLLLFVVGVLQGLARTRRKK